MATLNSSFISNQTLPFPSPTNLPSHSRALRRRQLVPIRMSLPDNSNSNSSTDPITSLTRLLWGRALPPQPLISAVRSTWSATWLLMMRQLAPSSSSGSYSRPPGLFPSVPSLYHSSPQTPNATNSLHLYVGLPCPWAHRTLIVRALKNLEAHLPVSVAAPGSDGSWEFHSGPTDGSVLVAGPDKANRKKNLREVYRMRRGGYDGRSTVPMLWDVKRKEVVCNESYGIIEFLNSGFAAGSGPDLCPVQLRGEIERWNQVIYPAVNNGVYRCGFAQSQEAYDTAVNELFTTLDKLESHLSTNQYLCGDTLTLSDVCLFTTLIRFDLVYNVLFKCTKRKIIEYPNLYAYTRDIYQMPKVAETCNFEAIMDGYYRTLFPLNPGGIQPIMPLVCQYESLSKPHGREVLSLKSKQLQLSPP
ncbi:Glutathione S-transferase [Rhynchospora pubera]|uniref:Glutathione S-transferase n=2 Tax=Rhynchospora pubera TaxID=906938 RepID=A0AAV8E7X8_9POAL|nr:Glutathione S-transferase [Rhynchospora pubera]KAJ4775605.1 Glutathione S-transferase [Rhynchospora pubera]